MRRKPTLILCLTAWFFATGAHWDFVQVFAWVHMFSTNLETMTVREAARRTFEPEEKCNLCHTVEDGKRAQDESAGVLGEFFGKAPVVFQQVARIFVDPPVAEPRMFIVTSFDSQDRKAPSLPPPRSGRV